MAAASDAGQGVHPSIRGGFLVNRCGRAWKRRNSGATTQPCSAELDRREIQAGPSQLAESSLAKVASIALVTACLILALPSDHLGLPELRVC